MNNIYKIILLLTSFLLIALVFMLIYLYRQEIFLRDKIYPNVFINNMNFGGQTKTSVSNYFFQQNKQFERILTTVFYQDTPVATFSGTQLKIRYDGQGLADRAYLIGRSSHLLSRTYQKLAAIFNWQTFKISASLGYDKNQLFDLINNMKENYDKPAKNALFKFEDGRVVSFRQEEKGLEIDAEAFSS